MPRSEPTRPLAALSPAETAELIRLAAGQVVLELGTFHGRATFAMAAGAREVWSVDWHRGDRYMGSPDSLIEFAHRLQRSPYRRKIVAVVATFGQLLPALCDQGFGLVFYDGVKEGPGLGRDLFHAARVLQPGGALALHDWGRWDVSGVASRLLGPPARVVDSLAVWTATKGRSGI